MGRLYKFGGMETNIPGIYSDRKFPPSSEGVGAATSVVVIMGEANGGIPYNASGELEERLNFFESDSDALDVLKGGNAYYATEFFLTPSNDERFAKPGSAIVCVVNQMTKSGSALQDSESNDIIDLASVRYGLSANQIARKIAAGTNYGKKIILKYQDKIILEKDDVGAEYLAIQYTGEGSAATLTITGTALTTAITGTTEDNLDITLADFENLNQLVSFIDEQAGYSCLLRGNGDANPSVFDAVTTQSIMTEYVARADVEAIIQAINTCKEVTAELHASAVRSAIVNDANFVFFTGGSRSAATSEDWSAALSMLSMIRLNHIAAATGDSSIQAMVNSHNQQMSGIEEKKYRRGGAGASESTISQSARIAEMKALNSSRMEYCITPFFRYDKVNGGKKEFAPFFLHAMIAGLRYANHITFDTTFKNLNILGVAETYTKTEMKRYIAAGATIVQKGEAGFEVMANPTTYQGVNLILLTPSMMRTIDYITEDSEVKIKNQLAALDRAPDEVIISKIENWLSTELLKGYRDTDKVLTKDPTTGAKAYSNVSFKLLGNKFEFKYRGVVVAPIQFGFVTHEFVTVGQR